VSRRKDRILSRAVQEPASGQLTMGLLASAVFFYVLAVATRVLFLFPLRNSGVDAFYFLKCSETFRAERRLPIVLDGNYLLEPATQSYPPGFVILISLLPPAWLKKYHWALNHCLDCLLAAVLFSVVSHQVGWGGGIVAGALYVLQPSVLGEFRTLTSRPLGLLLFTLGSLSLVLWGDMLAGVAIASVIVACMVFTHKLSLQVAVFVFPAMGLLTREPAWVVVLVIGYALAWIAGGRIFRMVLAAHWDIIRFWSREWPYLGAHAVKGSPIYGSGDGGARKGAAYGSGWRGLLRLLKQLLHHCHWLPFLIYVAWAGRLSGIEERLFWLVACGYASGCLVALVPALRGFGHGFQYFKYFSVPLFAVVGSQAVTLLEHSDWIGGILLVGPLLLTSYQLTIAWRNFQQSDRPETSQGSELLAPVVEYVRGASDCRLFCLPLHLSDAMAYRADVPVLWGTHGYGFDNVVPIFPILRMPLPDLVVEHGLTHLLLDEGYCSRERLKLGEAEVVCESGPYKLIAL